MSYITANSVIINYTIANASYTIGVCTIELSHWYKVDKVFYTPEAKLRCVKITSYVTKRS